MANEKFQNRGLYTQPCKSIGMLSKLTKSVRYDTDYETCLDYAFFMDLNLIFGEFAIYKEITIVASYSFKTLIGNAGNVILENQWTWRWISSSGNLYLHNYFYSTGGYIGLFIGVTVAQIPEMVTELVTKVKKLFKIWAK